MVIDLDSSEDDQARPPKRRRCVSPVAQAPSLQGEPLGEQKPRATTAIFLNRLLDVDGRREEVELGLQDIFEKHPSGDGQPPQEVLLANFMLDLPWLFDECPSLLLVPRLTVLHGDGCRDASDVERMRKGRELTRFHAPPLPLQWGTHHSKLVLLFYGDCLRICVRTFNDLYPDVHSKSQAMYLQDFPRYDGGSPGSKAAIQDPYGTAFEQYLREYLERCGGFDVNKLAGYDFSSAAASLVASVPGYHSRAEQSKWGHMRLRHLLTEHAVRSSACDTGDEGLLCQFSSLGSLSTKWLEQEFAETLSSLCGRTPSWSTRLPLRLVMPTVSQIRDSSEGWVAGASVPVRHSNLKPFLMPLLRRWGFAPDNATALARRSRHAMPHVKVFCRYAALPGGRGALLPWLYVGSHNLSKAAWGELQKNGSQLAIRSYELGAVFFPRRLRELEPDLERPQGHFLRRSTTATLPLDAMLLAGEGHSGLVAVPVACPTAVPPAGAPEPGDPTWAVDLSPETCSGLDRFGTRLGERQPQFYGRRAATQYS